jgi:uncharacterized lipoprotein NlpE involved in copper resistance
MNKIIILIFSIAVLLSCKNESKTNSQGTDSETELNADQSSERTNKQKDGLTLLKGDFLYMADAAVLQTHQLIYGVVINEKMHELNDLVSKYKKEDTDMIPVEIRGAIKPKPSDEEGWEFRVEIKEIINVSEPDPERSDVIKLGN